MQVGLLCEWLLSRGSYELSIEAALELSATGRWHMTPMRGSVKPAA
jgi:hypothetical protein